jgi:hypothetical protein
MHVTWAELKIPDADFNIVALHTAIDARRIERGLSWKGVAHEVNRADERYGLHPISPSTISGLKNKRWGVEGDGVLQMLLWLDRTREFRARPSRRWASRCAASMGREEQNRAL